VDCNQGGFLLDDEQFALFSRLPQGVSFTCIYDCCHSGTMSRAALAALAETPAEPATPRFMEPTPEMWAEYRRRRGGRSRGASRSLRTSEQLKGVNFSACRDDEVALERGGNGVFTRHVAPLVRDAYRARLSNEAFQRRLLARFPEPSQHPALDAASRNRSRAFLRPVNGRAAEAAAEVPEAPGLIAVPADGDGPARFFASLTREQRDELRRLLEESPEAGS